MCDIGIYNGGRIGLGFLILQRVEVGIYKGMPPNMCDIGVYGGSRIRFNFLVLIEGKRRISEGCH